MRTKFYFLSVLIIVFCIQASQGQKIEAPFSEPVNNPAPAAQKTNWFPVVFGTKNDGLPAEMKIRGVIEDVTYGGIGCGILLWHGTAKIKLLNRVRGYRHEYAYVIAPCMTNDKNSFLNQIVEIKVSKIIKGRKKTRWYETPWNPFDSNGLAFYIWNPTQK